MPDQVYLSYWLRGFNERNLLRSFEKLLERFPFSTAPQGFSTLRVYAIEFAEPALLETSFDRLPQPRTLIESAAEFMGPDCACLVTGHWDLWQDDHGWKLLPAPVVLGCIGPQFEGDLGDQLRLDLGPDSHFLPRPGQPASARKMHSNIQGLLRLARELDQALPVERRSLWTESGEDFVERLRSSMATTGTAAPRQG